MRLVELRPRNSTAFPENAFGARKPIETKPDNPDTCWIQNPAIQEKQPYTHNKARPFPKPPARILEIYVITAGQHHRQELPKAFHGQDSQDLSTSWTWRQGRGKYDLEAKMWTAPAQCIVRDCYRTNTSNLKWTNGFFWERVHESKTKINQFALKSKLNKQPYLHSVNWEKNDMIIRTLERTPNISLNILTSVWQCQLKKLNTFENLFRTNEIS